MRDHLPVCCSHGASKGVGKGTPILKIGGTLIYQIFMSYAVDLLQIYFTFFLLTPMEIPKAAINLQPRWEYPFIVFFILSLPQLSRYASVKGFIAPRD